jgi:hypothetical protein
LGNSIEIFAAEIAEEFHFGKSSNKTFLVVQNEGFTLTNTLTLKTGELTRGSSCTLASCTWQHHLFLTK